MNMSAVVIPHHPILRFEPVGGTITPGKVTKRAVETDPRQKYFIYVPEIVAKGTSVLVSVHGISRNAKAHAKAFRPFADRYGVVIVAPLFSKKRFPGYQRLGLARRGDNRRPDLALQAILSEVTALTGVRTDRVYLFGYSGGGQFAHRYAMFYPQSVLAVAVGAPGWYTFPETQVRYPRGLRFPSRDDLPPLSLGAFSRVPMAVFVGQRDDQRDAAFKTSRRIDLQQGITRVERGRRWVNAMRAVAHKHGYETRYEFRVLDGCGHSFHRCMRRGDMGRHVFEFLFGSAADERIGGDAHWNGPLPAQVGAVEAVLDFVPGYS